MVYKEGFGKLFYASGQILIVINSQRSTNKLVIWSHCLWPFVSTFKRESLAGQFLLKNPTILWDNELKAQELYLWEQVLCSDDDYYNLSICNNILYISQGLLANKRLFSSYDSFIVNIFSSGESPLDPKSSKQGRSMFQWTKLSRIIFHWSTTHDIKILRNISYHSVNKVLLNHHPNLPKYDIT